MKKSIAIVLLIAAALAVPAVGFTSELNGADSAQVRPTPRPGPIPLPRPEPPKPNPLPTDTGCPPPPIPLPPLHP